MTSPVCTPPWAMAAFSADCRARYSRSASLRCSRANRCGGRDPGLPERLVGEQVTDAGDLGLIQQPRLDRDRALHDQLAELGSRDPFRVRPERVGVGIQPDPSQPALVEQGQPAAVGELERETVPFRLARSRFPARACVQGGLARPGLVSGRACRPVARAGPALPAAGPLRSRRCGPHPPPPVVRSPAVTTIRPPMPRWIPSSGPGSGEPFTPEVSHHMVLPRRRADVSVRPTSASRSCPGVCGRQTNASASSTATMRRFRA